MLKQLILITTLGLPIILGGCSHLGLGKNSNFQPNKPIKQSQQIYYAPAQTYNLDLNSPALLGKLDLKESCTPEGNSLSITDQLGRFYRVDAINLNHNPKLPEANENEQDIQSLTSQLASFYGQFYQAEPIAPAKAVRSALGASGYVALKQDEQHSIGLLMHQRGDYAYVLQHTQTQYDAARMQQALAQLAQNMQIPGRQLKGSNTELALSIDLSQASPSQLSNWKKSAHCS